MDAQKLLIYLLLYYASKLHLSFPKDFKNNSVSMSREWRIDGGDRRVGKGPQEEFCHEAATDRYMGWSLNLYGSSSFLLLNKYY